MKLVSTPWRVSFCFSSLFSSEWDSLRTLSTVHAGASSVSGHWDLSAVEGLPLSSFDASSSQVFCRVSFDGCSFELPIDGRLWKVFEEPTAVETISKDQRAVWISFCEQHRIPNASEVHFDHSHSNLRFWTIHWRSTTRALLPTPSPRAPSASSRRTQLITMLEWPSSLPLTTQQWLPLRYHSPLHCNHSRAPSWLWSLTKPPWTRSPTC